MNRPGLIWQDIRLFFAVAENGIFSAAARELRFDKHGSRNKSEHTIQDQKWICWPEDYDYLPTNQALKTLHPNSVPTFTSTTTILDWTFWHDLGCFMACIRAIR